MENSISSTLRSPDYYLDLKGSQFRIPLELIKKNFRNLQKLVEKHKAAMEKQLEQLKGAGSDKKARLKAVNKLIKAQEQFGKKLSTRVRQHNEFVDRLVVRARRLKQLEQATTEQQVLDFYRDEINLITIDFLLKTSRGDSPLHNLEENPGYRLAQNLGVAKLIDYDVILQGLTIYNEIKQNRNLKLLVAWCSENRKKLASIRQSSASGNNLEFETYFQRFIEKVKEGDVYGALSIARNNLVKYIGQEWEEEEEDGGAEDEGDFDDVDDFEDSFNEGPLFDKLSKGSSLLWYNNVRSDFESLVSTEPVSHDPYASHKRYYDSACLLLDRAKANVASYEQFLDSHKWSQLADFFLYNFNMLYGIDQTAPILNMLSLGGSALKTRSCDTTPVKAGEVTFDPILQGFKHTATSRKLDMFTTNQCPVCSVELKELTSALPFSHQVKSNIYDNPVMLPSGNIYPADKLLMMNRNLPHHRRKSDGLPVEERRQELDDIIKDDDDSVGDEVEDFEETSDSSVEPDYLGMLSSKRSDVSMQALENLVLTDPATGIEYLGIDAVRVFPT